MPRITNRVVNAASPEQKDTFIWASDLPGFGLRIFPSGRRSYLIQYRFEGRQRRYTIELHGKLTPAQARTKAVKLFGDILDGKDPAAARHEARSEPSVDEFAQTYLTRYARSEKKPTSFQLWKAAAPSSPLPSSQSAPTATPPFVRGVSHSGK